MTTTFNVPCRTEPAGKPVSAWTGWAQWIALATMLVDHLVRFVFQDPGLQWLSSTIGRVALPVFAGMVAWHALFNTRDPYRYARRVLLIGIIAQPAYMLMPRPDEAFILNVCFTLAAGLAAGIWIRQLWDVLQDSPTGIAFVRLGTALAGIGVAWLSLGDWLEYGHEGLLVVPLFMLAIAVLQRSGREPVDVVGAVTASLPLLVVAGSMNVSVEAKLFTVGSCLVILAFAAGLAQRIPGVPLLMPRRLWLSWYPGHFLVIALVLWWPW